MIVNTRKNIEEEISSISFFLRMERNDFASHFDNHLAKMLQFLLEYQKDIQRKDFHFTYANYFGLEQFITEEIDIFEKNIFISEPDWNLIEEMEKKLRTKIKESLEGAAEIEYYYPFIKFTTNCFENYWLYQTAHPNTTNNPWEAVWKMIQKGYIFCVTADEKLIQEYAPHFRKPQNNNIVLLVASPNSQNYKAIYKTIDDSFHFQFHLFKFLEGNKISKQNAMPLSSILAKMRISPQKQIIEKAVKYLQQNHLIAIDNENRLFIPQEEDVVQTPDYQKLVEKLHFHQQKAKEISLILENKYSFITKSTVNI